MSSSGPGYGGGKIKTKKNVIAGFLFPSLRDSRYPSLRGSRYPSSQRSRYPSLRGSRYPSLRDSRYPSLRGSRYPSSQRSRYPSLRGSRYPSLRGTECRSNPERSSPENGLLRAAIAGPSMTGGSPYIGMTLYVIE